MEVEEVSSSLNEDVILEEQIAPAAADVGAASLSTNRKVSTGSTAARNRKKSRRMTLTQSISSIQDDQNNNNNNNQNEVNNKPEVRYNLILVLAIYFSRLCCQPWNRQSHSLFDLICKIRMTDLAWQHRLNRKWFRSVKSAGFTACCNPSRRLSFISSTTIRVIIRPLFHLTSPWLRAPL